jgi:hypothetical protein
MYFRAAILQEREFSRRSLADPSALRRRTAMLAPILLSYLQMTVPHKIMRLASIAHDRIRFAVTILGITCAVFSMVFQGSVLAGFMRAASRIIDSMDADLWITRRGVKCFEFPVVHNKTHLRDSSRHSRGSKYQPVESTPRCRQSQPRRQSSAIVLRGCRGGRSPLLAPIPRECRWQRRCGLLWPSGPSRRTAPPATALQRSLDPDGSSYLKTPSGYAGARGV